MTNKKRYLQSFRMISFSKNTIFNGFSGQRYATAGRFPVSLSPAQNPIYNRSGLLFPFSGGETRTNPMGV